MAEDSGKCGKGGRLRKGLFYGKKGDDGDSSDHGDISGASDDSVDDPSYILKDLSDVEKEMSDNGDGDGGNDDDDDDNANIASDTVNVGASTSGSGDRSVGEPRVPGKRKGSGRGKAAGTVIEKTGRKRSIRKEEWLTNKAKKQRNLGQEYKCARSEKRKRARRIGPPCNDGCFEKVSPEARDAIFKNFWEIGDYDAQNAYISQHVRPVPVKRRRKKDSDRVNYEYRLKYFDQTFLVCRKAFVSIHDICISRLKIHIQKMKNSPTGTPEGDKRGRQPNPKKITGIRKERVHEHIESLPTTSSHYTRAKSPLRIYLESGTTVKALYEKYTFWMQEFHPEDPTVTYHYYADIFANFYNIGVKPPKKDTCTTCDGYNADIVRLQEKEEDDSALKARLQEHKEQGELVQRLLSSQADASPVRGMDVRVVCMDLQQTLPCPRLTSGIAYYLRKLWVYNFCIYDVTKGKVSMFVWDEITGGRGSDEVASMIMKWLQLRREEGDANFDILRIFCDNCAGQNKNINVLLAALRIVHEKLISRIEFVYMVSGHSYLPCDRAFGVIEKKLRVSHDIMIPEHYVRVIRSATNPPYEVVPMERDDFKDIKQLGKFITKRQTPVSFAKACQLVVDMGYKEGYLIKTDYNFLDTEENTHRCRLMKTNRRYSSKLFDLSNCPLAPKYPCERLLNPAKVRDLERLAKLMTPTSEAWTLEVVRIQKEMAAENHPVAHPDDEDVGSDSENDLMDYDAPVCSPVKRRK